jgi:tetratricopeptide (TPR) repeat protein
MSNKLRYLAVLLVVSLLAVGGAGCTRAAKKNRYLDRANRYFQAGDYEKAEIEYVNVLRLEPKNPVAVPRLGLICAEQGRLTAAYSLLRRAEESQPDNLDVRLKLGQTYFNLAGLKEAREEANYILQKQPTNAEALLLLVESSTTAKEMDDVQDRLQKLLPQYGNEAGLQLALGFLHLRRPDLAGAEGEIKQAIVLDPKSSAAYQVLGTYYLLRNDSKQAEQAFKTASDLAPIRSPRRLRYADFKLQNGDIESARQILEDITAKAPDYVPAWTRLADIAFKQKKYDDCEKVVRTILSKDALHYETRMLSGRVRLAKGEGTKAVTEFERMRSIYPRSPQVKYQLALAYLLNKDLAKATASLAEATALDPNYADAVLMLAQINLRKGDTASVITSLTQLTTQRPQLAQAHLLLADAYRVQGDLDGALGVYRRLLELYPKDPQSPMLMGLVLLQQNKKSEAHKAFEKALELAPDYLPALEQLVELDVADKQYAAATERVQKQIEKHPKAPEPQLLAAKIYEAKGETNQLEASLLKAIELQPDFRPAYLSLAKIYVASNKYQQALEKLKGVLAGNPNDTTALMQAGMIQSETKNYAAAAASYEKLLAVSPRFSPALNNLAYLYSERLERTDEAYKLARQAREVQPNDPFAADTLGWILYKRGEYAWALTLLQESAEKLPASPEVQFHLGMAHYMMDEAGPARIALERALQANHEFAGKDQIERRLKVLAVDVNTADAKVIAELEKRLAEQADDPAALARLAAIEERDGVFEKARDLYERTIKQNPKNVSATVKLAQLYADRFNNTAKAMELAKIARNLAPEDGAIARTLGRLAYQAGDFKWSLSLLEEGARVLSKDPEVLYDLAWSQYSLGRTAEAEATMLNAQKKGIALPHSDEASRFLATSPLYRDPAKAKQATAQVQDLLKADPNYVPALMAAATIDEQEGDVNAAKTAYDKTLARFPFFAPAHKLLAVLYAERIGDYQRAYEPAVKAREAFPDDPDVAKTLGMVVYRRGDYKRAAQLLRESAEKRTTDAELYYYLGMAHYQLKQKSESKRALNQAMALNANAKFVEEAKKVLAELK